MRKHVNFETSVLEIAILRDFWEVIACCDKA